MNNFGQITRRGLIAALLASGATAAIAAPTKTLRPVLRPAAQIRAEAQLQARPALRSTAEDLIKESGLGGQTGFVIADARTGEILEAVDPDTQRPPASVTKAVTALYALESLGPDHRFATRVLATGPVENGMVMGDLILVGGGDPTLDTDNLADLVAQLGAQGITGVTGQFRVWGGALPGVKEIEPGQLDQLGYNPSLGGLNLNFNRVYFEWARGGDGYNVSMDARSGTRRPMVTVARMRVVDRSMPVYTYAEGSDFDDWSVAKGALGKAGSRWLPVRFPALYAAEVFQVIAQDEGIALPKVALMDDEPDGDLLALHESVPLGRMARDMMLYSTNLTAEALGMLATDARVGTPRGMRTSALSMATWSTARSGIAPQFSDHSGLSDENRISARQMVTLLTADDVASTLRPIMKDIPIVDNSRRRIEGFPGEVQAKTGTLNFVSALAGYATTQDGRDLAFAIFSYDADARSRSLSSLDERPAGAAGFNGKAKRLQQSLLQRWLILGDLTR